MTKDHKPDPSILIIFGAGGDLSWRKLVPAVFNLTHDGWLDEKFCVLGIDRKPMDETAYRDYVRKGVAQDSRIGPITDDVYNTFATRLHYRTGDLGDPKTYKMIADFCAAREAEWGGRAQRIFYLAISPSLIGTVCNQLEAAGFPKDREGTRLIVEKPFGRDLASAKSLNATITKGFDESQVYRIDHYSARRRSRTSSRSGSPTRCSSRSGTGGTPTTCRSPWPRRSGWSTGPGTTTRPGRCGTWCRTTSCSCSA